MHLAENFEESKPMKYMTKSSRPKNFVSGKKQRKKFEVKASSITNCRSK